MSGLRAIFVIRVHVFIILPQRAKQYSIARALRIAQDPETGRRETGVSIIASNHRLVKCDFLFVLCDELLKQAKLSANLWVYLYKRVHAVRSV